MGRGRQNPRHRIWGRRAAVRARARRGRRRGHGRGAYRTAVDVNQTAVGVCTLELDRVRARKLAFPFLDLFQDFMSPLTLRPAYCNFVDNVCSFSGR